MSSSPGTAQVIAPDAGTAFARTTGDMKEILKQLLEAEQGGRQAAAHLEEEARLLLQQAEREGEEIVRQQRSATSQQIAQWEEEAQAQIEAGRRAIACRTEEALKQMRRQALERRSEAVARVMAILLAEVEPPGGTGP